MAGPEIVGIHNGIQYLSTMLSTGAVGNCESFVMKGG
jgi:hypothetical protein